MLSFEFILLNAWTAAEIQNAIFDPDVAALILENKNM